MTALYEHKHTHNTLQLIPLGLIYKRPDMKYKYGIHLHLCDYELKGLSLDVFLEKYFSTAIIRSVPGTVPLC